MLRKCYLYSAMIMHNVEIEEMLEREPLAVALHHKRMEVTYLRRDILKEKQGKVSDCYGMLEN